MFQISSCLPAKYTSVHSQSFNHTTLPSAQSTQALKRIAAMIAAVAVISAAYLCFGPWAIPALFIAGTVLHGMREAAAKAKSNTAPYQSEALWLEQTGLPAQAQYGHQNITHRTVSSRDVG